MRSRLPDATPRERRTARIIGWCSLLLALVFSYYFYEAIGTTIAGLLFLFFLLLGLILLWSARYLDNNSDDRNEVNPEPDKDNERNPV